MCAIGPEFRTAISKNVQRYRAGDPLFLLGTDLDYRKRWPPRATIAAYFRVISVAVSRGVMMSQRILPVPSIDRHLVTCQWIPSLPLVRDMGIPSWVSLRPFALSHVADRHTQRVCFSLPWCLGPNTYTGVYCLNSACIPTHSTGIITFHGLSTTTSRRYAP